MFKTEDERREKFRLQSGSAQKTANTGIMPQLVTDFGINPGFRLENSLLSAQQEQQTYTQLANSFSQKALNEELLGNYPDSRYLWGQAAAMSREAEECGKLTSVYEMTLRPPTGRSIWGTSNAPNSAPQAIPNSAPQTTPETAPTPEPEISVPDYDSAVSSAQEAYEAYKTAQKEFDKEYTWRKNPESASGYDYAYATLQELKQTYLESVDYLLDHHDSFETDAGIASQTNGTVTDREALQTQLDQMTRQMWDYYNADPENADPAAIAWYIEKIAAAKAAMASLPEEAIREDILLQAIGGNYYTGDPTLSGTAGMMTLGALGLDMPADLLDISYDIENWKDVSAIQKVTDFAALLPFVGAIKYVEDAADAVKTMGKVAGAAEDAADAVKAAEPLTDAAKARRYQELMGAVAAQAGDSDKLIDTGTTLQKALDETGNVGYSKISSLKTTQGITMGRKNFARLMVDVSENGIKEPIKYVSLGDTYYVVDGHHRLYAAKKLGLDSVPTEEVTLPYKGHKTIDDLFWRN